MRGGRWRGSETKEMETEGSRLGGGGLFMEGTVLNEGGTRESPKWDHVVGFCNNDETPPKNIKRNTKKSTARLEFLSAVQ